MPASPKATAPAWHLRLADKAHSVKIAVWKNHESNLDLADKKWMNQAIVLTSLKVGGEGSDDNTELTTTMASRIWAASEQLQIDVLARAVSPDQLTSISKAHEGTTVDYSAIDGEPIHLSSLAWMLMPKVSASLAKTYAVCHSASHSSTMECFMCSYDYVKETHAQVPS